MDRQNKKWKKITTKIVSPNEYEEICSDCNGLGIMDSWYPNYYVKDKNSKAYYEGRGICYKCRGTGKIDWINIIKNGEINEL